MSDDLFEPEQVVSWKNPNDTTAQWYMERAYLPPFVVKAIVPVPVRECTCEASADYPLHMPTCALEQENYVGHSQWVTIEDGRGQTLLGMRGEETLFSGSYFVRN